MPFLRVVRDKRGYETTYLMHWFREGTRQRSRILYVFRSPGGVRVGREPLEPEVLRDIESLFPAIDFDWKAVLSNRQVIESAPEPRRRRRRAADAEPSGSEAPAATAAPPEVAAPAAEVPPPSRPAIPSAIEGATPAEQTAFLAEWYPIVRDWIPQRTADPVRREALMALAERLNPAAWTDADQIAADLERAAEALGRLARVFARRRRRPRRSSSRPAPSPAAAREPDSRTEQGGQAPDSDE